MRQLGRSRDTHPITWIVVASLIITDDNEIRYERAENGYDSSVGVSNDPFEGQTG